MESNPRSPPPPPPKKRPPLSDRTNFTVPTSVVLRTLKSSLSSLKPPIPNPNTKPNRSSSVPKRIIDLDCSESETSIGSSTFDGIDRNPNRVPGNKSGDEFGPICSKKKAPEKTKDKEEQTFMPLIIYSAKKSSAKGKSAAPPSGKTKNIENVVPVSISGTSMMNAKNKMKENVEPLTCPLLQRTRKRSTVSNEAENKPVSHPHTAPAPSKNKKRSRFLVDEDVSINFLPAEYVEQQQAYFKEIDAFELAEEEVSENESENEDTSRETLTK